MINEVVQTMLNVGGKAAYMADMNAVSLAASAAGQSMDYATRATTMLGAGLAGLVGGLTLSSVAAIGSEFENTQLKMAGTLTALGFAADYMNDGLSMAASTMTQIKAAAAALPGEAQDYVAVFSATLPNVQAAVGGTMQEMTKFTNQLTAIGTTFGIDSTQIAGDLNRMLGAKGGAGADVRTFQQLIPFMRTLEGQANLTADAFNKMTQTKRAELLKGTFASFGPMLEQAANSWDAIMGTTKGVASEIWRMGTAPIFELMKSSLAKINSQLMDGEGNLIGWGAQIARIGEVLSMGVAGTIRMIPTWIEIGREKLDQFASQLQSMPILNAILSPGDGGMSFIQGVGSGLMGAFDNVAATVLRLGDVIGPLLKFYTTYEAIVYTALLPAAEGLSEGIYKIVDALVGALLPLFDQVSTTLEQHVFPVLTSFGSAIGDVFSALGEFLGPLITLTGAFLGKLYEVVGVIVIPIFHDLASDINKLLGALADLFRWLGKVLGDAATFYGIDTKGSGKDKKMEGAASDMLGGFKDLIAKLKNKMQVAAIEKIARADAAKQPRMQARAQGKTTQDFRFSRFDITQKFEEGFDPDRFLVAFSQDLARAGEMKVQTGFEPIYTSR